MIDPKLLRQSPLDIKANLARRGFEFDAGAYADLDERRKVLQVTTESLRNERNSSSRQIGNAKSRGEDVEPLLASVRDLGDRLEQNEEQLQLVLSGLQ